MRNGRALSKVDTLSTLPYGPSTGITMWGWCDVYVYCSRPHWSEVLTTMYTRRTDIKICYAYCANTGQLTRVIKP